jgi:hypothetical protein
MKKILLLLTAALMLKAQTATGVITGTVQDTDHAAVTGSTVTVKNEKTGQLREARTNDSGSYTINNLSASNYTIHVFTPGFADIDREGINLTVGQQIAVNFVVVPQIIKTEITVDGGEVITVDSTSAKIGVNVSEREVANLPINGRQISQLYLLAPGASTAGGGSYDNIRFSGRSNQQNAIRYDGVEGSSIIDSSPGNLNGQISSFFRLQSSLENVQEFRVESNNYPAEYGTGTGGQITVITKSGGNSTHGSLFEYLRNDALDARNFFDGASKNPLRLNQFGGSAGGAVVKDRTFWFASNENLRQRQSIPFREAVPSDSARARAVAAVQPLLSLFPRGTIATADPNASIVTADQSQRVNETSVGARLDHRWNDQVNSYLRYFRDQGNSIQPLGVTGNGIAVTAVPQNAVFNTQWIVSPQMINEFKVGVNAYKTRAWGSAPVVNGFNPADISVNLTGGVAIAGIGSQGANAGFATPGGLVRSNSATNGRGQPYTNTSWSFIDNLTWIKGSHNVKMGGEYRRIQLLTDRLGGTTYSFSNVEDLINNRPTQIQFLGDLGAPSPFNGGATGRRDLRQYYLIGYVQDEWHVTPTVNVNYGLRYEYYSVMKEARNLAVIWSPETGQLLPNTTPVFKSNPRNFGPRLSISWNPAHSKTTIRVGSGLYYGPGQPEDMIQPFESDRVSTTLTNAVYPIVPANVIANYNINSSSLKFQPRAYDSGYSLPERILSYTASIQHQLDNNTVLTVAYVGSQGRNLFMRSWGNAITAVATNPTTGAAVVTRQFGDRWAEVDVKTSGGRDHYNALQTTLNRKSRNGLTYGVSYTWGRSIGNSGGSNETVTVADRNDWSKDYGNNLTDIRHNINAVALYEIKWLRGLQIGTVINSRTGLPLDPLIVRNDIVYQDKRTGLYYNNPIVENGSVQTAAVVNTPGGGQSRQIRRPDYVAGVDPYVQANGTVFLNPAAFSTPLPGTFGNAGRYSLHGPSLFQADFTVQKQFKIKENTSVQLRAEVYNVLNHTNFANPPAQLPNALPSKIGQANSVQPGQAFGATTQGATFGVFNSTLDRTVGLGTSRQMQLSMRVNF